VADPGFDLEEVIAETIEFVRVRPEGEGWVGDAPSWFGERLFGGFVLAQCVNAATRTAADGRRIHSIHGYFLRPVMAGQPLSYRATPIRDGRSFAIRHLEATQAGAPVFSMMCSFTNDTDEELDAFLAHVAETRHADLA
jgi:acyl-CoA thioesterase II